MKKTMRLLGIPVMIIISMSVVVFLAACGGSSGGTQTAVVSADFPVWSPGAHPNFTDQVKKIIADKGLSTIKIGFSGPAMSEYYNEVYSGAHAKMRELQDIYGIKFEYVASSGTTHADAESQISALRSWAQQGFHAVVVCTSAEPAAMDSVFGELLKSGTYPYFFNMPSRVMALNPDSPLDAVTMNARAIIGYDHYLAYSDAAAWLAELLTIKNGSPRGKIGQVWGPGGHWSTERGAGFADAIKNYPNIEVVPLVRAQYDRDTGMKGGEDLLTLYPDLDAIYAENEEMALGAAAGAMAQGKTLWDFDKKDGLIVIGVDGLVSGYNEMRAGRLTGTIDVNAVENGAAIVEAIFWDRVLGWKIPKIIQIPTSVVDVRTVDMHEAYIKFAQSVDYPSGGF